MQAMSIQTRVAAGIPAGGQFATIDRPEAPTALSVEPVVVHCTDGRDWAVTPGVLDEIAVHVFQNGQCLALAVAVAEKHSQDHIGVFMMEDEQEPDLEWRLLHAVALHRDNDAVVIDSDGSYSLDEMKAGYERDYGDRWDYGEMTIDEARELAAAGRGVDPQQWELAKTMVDQLP